MILLPIAERVASTRHTLVTSHEAAHLTRQVRDAAPGLLIGNGRVGRKIYCS